MSIETEIPARLRAALLAVLPERAFLRRDRGDGLFISNAPAFDPGIREIPGFIVEQSGSLLRILPDESWIRHLEACRGNGPDELSRSLRGHAPDRENLVLFARGVKLLDAAGSASAEDATAYDRSLRQRAAVALRGGCGGGLYAAALLNCEIQHLKGAQPS